MKNVAIVLFSIINMALVAQLKQDSPWEKHYMDREVLPYQKVREADVFWSKRLWRVIDFREKQNLVFAYPQLSLMEIVHTAAKNGEIAAYDNSVIDGDQFKMEMSIKQVESIGESSETMWINDAETYEEREIVINDELNYRDIIKFKVKEDWFFNSATSTMEVRIIGIAPVMAVKDEYGNYLGDETLYWLYYPDLRPILAKYEAFNKGNNAVRLSWDDIFEARLFSSYVIQEDNVYDRPISDYAKGVDALLESERIEEKIFNFEHDLWSY